MARERFPGDRFKFNTRQRLTSTDLQEAVELGDLTSRRVYSPFVRFMDSHSGFVIQGMKVSEDSPTAMTLRVSLGRCVIWNATETDGIDASVFDENNHGYHEACIDGSIEEVTIAANSSGNPRIDVIVARLAVEDAEEQNVDIFNTTTRVFDSTPNTPTRVRKRLTVSNGGIVVVQGTPGASPVIPAIDNYDIPLAKVYVANGASTLANAVINDSRIPMIEPKFTGRFNSDGTAFSYTFHGTTRSLGSMSGGIIDENYSVVFNSQPATGRYLFDVTGFKKNASNYPHILVTPVVNGTAPLLSCVHPLLGNQFEVRFFDHTGAATDSAFGITVEQLSEEG